MRNVHAYSEANSTTLRHIEDICDVVTADEHANVIYCGIYGGLKTLFSGNCDFYLFLFKK